MGPAVGECYAQPAFLWAHWLTHPASRPLASGLILSRIADTESQPMPDELRLREQARTAIQNGKLPSHAPDRTWGGRALVPLARYARSP
jgi:hypothetical protein